MRYPQRQTYNLRYPNANPKCESVEYRLRWVPYASFSRWLCTFLFIVSISFAFGCRSSVEYRLNFMSQKESNIPINDIYISYAAGLQYHQGRKKRCHQVRIDIYLTCLQLQNGSRPDLNQKKTFIQNK